MARQKARPVGAHKTDNGFELVLGPQILVWVLGAVAVLAVVLMGVAVGVRMNQPPTAAAPQTGQLTSGQTVSVPAGSVDPSTTQMFVAPQPSVDTKRPVSESEKPIGDAPRLSIPELAASNYTLALGKISPTQKVNRTVTVKNIGKQPLEITSVGSSCGCTAVVASDKTVQPGGETQIKLEFDPTVNSIVNSLVSSWFTITSNDPEAKLIKIDITAEVVGSK